MIRNGNIIDDLLAASGGGGDVSGKADKVASAVEGDLASLDASGNLADSGVPSAGETWSFTLADDTVVTKTVLAVTASAPLLGMVSPAPLLGARPAMLGASPLGGFAFDGSGETDDALPDAVTADDALALSDDDAEVVEVIDDTASEADDRDYTAGLLDDDD